MSRGYYWIEISALSSFEPRINQYFDGKKTDDEILHRAEISRKQLREVLHHYEEYVSLERQLYFRS